MPSPSPLLDISQITSNSLHTLQDIFHLISLQCEPSNNHLLILDQHISKYINRLTSFSDLKKETNIDQVVLLAQDLQLTDLLHSHKSIVFIANDSLTQINSILQLIKTKILPFNSQGLQISLIFTSSFTKFDNLAIENLNLKGDVHLYNWSTVKPIVLDHDLIALDSTTNSKDLKNIYQLNHLTSVTQLSKTLLDLVVLSNFKLRFTNVFLKGELAQFFYQSYQKNFNVHMQDEANVRQRKLLQEIDDVLFLDKHTFYNRQCDLVVLERSVDMITPLLTQLTYAGLIDETFGIEMGEIQHPIRHDLAKDPLYSSLKDLNFSQVGPILNSKLKSLQDQFDRRHAAKDIDEIKRFVDKLSDLTLEQNLIKDHTVIAELILSKVKQDAELDDEENDDTSNYFSAYIDLQQQILSNSYDNSTNFSKLLQFLYSFKPALQDFLKLVILTSIVKKGFRQKEYHNLRKEIVEFYGFEVFVVLQRLTELRLFHVRESSNELNLFTSLETVTRDTSPILETDQTVVAQQIRNFNQVNYFLNLTPLPPENGDELQDPDFVLPGYVPVLARLVELIYSRDFAQSSSIKVSGGHAKYGWSKINDTIGKYFHDSTSFQELSLVPSNKQQLFGTGPSAASSAGKKKQRHVEYIVVVMIGGVTYAELSAIRFVVDKINRKLEYNKKLLVLTNEVIKSDDIVEMCK